MSVNYIIGGLRKVIPGESSIYCIKIDLYSSYNHLRVCHFFNLVPTQGRKTNLYEFYLSLRESRYECINLEDF